MRRRYPASSCFTPGQQDGRRQHLRALGETFADLAAGAGISTATAWRYVNEAIALLSARAPKLRAALRAAKGTGLAFVILDGTLIPSTAWPRTGRFTPASTRCTA